MNVVFASRPARVAAAVLVLIAFAFMVTVNVLANALPLNGVSTATLSDDIPNLFVPAGITFAVWGPIYLLLAALVVAVLVQAFSREPLKGAWEPLDGVLFVVNGLANGAWIFAWHWRQILLSLALMLVILGTLIALSERAFRKVSAGGALHSGSLLLRLCMSTPIHVYLGWICVATIANATALLVTLGWGGWGLDPRVWTVVMIGAGLAVALGLVFRRRAVAAPLVVVWAYAGITIKRLPIDGSGDPAVWTAASVAAGIILLATVLRLLLGRRAGAGGAAT